MISPRSPLVLTVTVAACLVGHASTLAAQGIEVTPFTGYRFGGDFFELITGTPVDLDGATSFGMALDVPLSDGLQVEGLFTHQHAHVLTPDRFFGRSTLWRMSVDQWHGGGLQEFGRGRLKPFLTGTLGLTRYRSDTDAELRFALSAGGGMKVFPTSQIGLRLDGRLFATFVDANASILACSPGRCFLAVHADVIWQAEFTAGVVVRFVH